MTTAVPAFLVVLPGDDVTEQVEAAGATSVRLGSGLTPDAASDGGVIATKAGVLSFKAPNRFFVQSSAKRYAPAVGDTVVGVVADRLPEAYRMRINGTSVALLPMLAFDGASKRNKPNLLSGSVVFGRIAACSKFMEPELSCQTLGGPKRDWMTGQSVFGELKGGTLLEVSTALARRLLAPACVVLSELGRAWPFEVAVGLNGIVWLRAASGEEGALAATARGHVQRQGWGSCSEVELSQLPHTSLSSPQPPTAVAHTVAISTAISRSENLSDTQVPALVARLVAATAAAGSSSSSAGQ